VRYSRVGVRSLCVEYAWLWAGHASAVSAYASELIQNRARPRPSTDAPPSYHAWTAHVSRSFHWHPLTKVLVCGTFANCACLDALRHWFMRRACVECSRNTTPYLLVCVDVRDISLIVNDTCAVHAWFVSDFCPRHPKNLVNFSRTSTHKPNLCVFCKWFVPDRLCDWPLTWLGNVSHF